MTKKDFKIIFAIALISMLLFAFAGCTAVDEVTKMKGKGYQQDGSIDYMHDYMAWKVTFVKKDSEGKIVEKVTIYKCTSMSVASTFYDFHKSSINENHVIQKNFDKVYIGTKNAVKDAV